VAERPFQSDDIDFGVGGMTIRTAVDKIPPNKFSRLRNVTRTIDGAFTTRPGLTPINATYPGLIVHSLARLEDAPNFAWTRVWGIDSALCLGATEPTVLETGFSGNALSTVAYRPPLSSDPWIFVGDELKMRKVRRDGLILPIGLPAPVAAVTATPNASLTKTIDFCSAGWQAGTGGGCTGISIAYVTGMDGNSLRLTATSSAAEQYAFATKGLATEVDLTDLSGVDATDDDFIHVWLRASIPSYVSEIRVYFVCSPTFTADVVPGTHATSNTDAYVHSFRVSELADAFELTEPYITQSDLELRRRRRESELEPYQDTRVITGHARERNEEARRVTTILPAGRNQWIEFGDVAGMTLRRGDFQRIGSSERDWSTITGVILLMQFATAGTVDVSIDGLELRGGFPLDSIEPGNTAYDWRVTNYDPRTGAESNPSPEMSATLDVARRSVAVTAAAYGDANIRQRLYRRGGTISDDWYFVSTNASDGADFTDTTADVETVAAGALARDHDQPVTTTASDGSTLSNVALPSLWGPVAGLFLMGCGDPNRPGNVYWCKGGEPDHWPVANNVEVCSPSELLLAGLTYNGTPFVFSRDRLYRLYYNFGESGTTFSPQVTPCSHGIVGRHAFAVGPEIYFVARDGIYATSGDVERSLTEEDLGPLFHRYVELRDDESSVATSGSGYGEGGYGEGGYGTGISSAYDAPPAIDWSAPDRLRLAIWENGLYFAYQDISGTTQVLRYDLLLHEWTWYNFAVPIMTIEPDQYAQDSTLLLGSNNGHAYTHEGLSDAGTIISCLVRSGARTQGNRRAQKLYGDLALDLDASGTTVSVRTYLNPVETFNSATSATGAARTLGVHDHFSGGVHAQSCTIELVWASSSGLPRLYAAHLSYLIDPDLIVQRVTDWSDLGTPGQKLVKGLILEVDTYGSPKTFAVEADNAVATTFTVTTGTRQQVEVPFTAFRARLLRLRPTGTGSYLHFNTTWIAEDLPLMLPRWETRSLDAGTWGYLIFYDAYVTLLSTSDVSFRLTVDGVAQTYTIPSTDGLVEKVYVPFYPTKGKLAEYLLTASAPFALYKEETAIRVFPWGGDSGILLRPFGGANLDPPTRV